MLYDFTVREASTSCPEMEESFLTILWTNVWRCWKAGYFKPFYPDFMSIDLLFQMLPEIRHDLFGTNENRKFYT